MCIVSVVNNVVFTVSVGSSLIMSCARRTHVSSVKLASNPFTMTNTATS